MAQISGAPVVPPSPATALRWRWPAARIRTSKDGTFRRDPEGEPALIWPVFDSDDDMVDLVAWDVDAPSRWWLLYRDEAIVLGAHTLAIARYFQEPIILHSVPQQWLVTGRTGVCVLRWDVPLPEILEGVPEITCDSAWLKRRLQKALRQNEPKMIVEARHAA